MERTDSTVRFPWPRFLASVNDFQAHPNCLLYSTSQSAPLLSFLRGQMTKHCTRWNLAWQTYSIIVNEDNVSAIALLVLSLEPTYILLVITFSSKEVDVAPSLPSLLIATGRRSRHDSVNSVSVMTPKHS